MQRHHPNRRQSYHHQLDNQYQQHPQPRQRSRQHRLIRAGYNDQPTPRRRGAAGKRSTTSTTKRNLDHGSKGEYKSIPHLNPRGAEFESIRLTTRIEEWYRSRAPDEELTEAPAQKGILRISNIDQAVQPRYLYDPEKDDTDLHREQILYEPPRRRNVWGPRPYSLAEIIYEYDTEDEGQRGYERDSQDRFFEHHTHPLHQYLAYLEDRGRQRCVLTDTGDELVYSQWQPGLEIEVGNCLED